MKWAVRIALGYLITLFLVAIAAPFLVATSPEASIAARRTLYPHSPFQVHLDQTLRPPDSQHPAGTDILGRDILARIILGTRSTILTSVVATLVSLLIGVPLGALAGYRGGIVEAVFKRLVEVFFSLPMFFFLVLIAGLMPLTAFRLALLLGLTGWIVPARYMYNEVHRLMGMDFVRYARHIGASFGHLLRVHLIPNGIAPVIVSASFNMASLIMVEATLSFLGLGIPPPLPSWGGMIHEGMSVIRIAPWVMALPVGLVFGAIFSYDVLGQSLRRRLQRR